MSDSIDVYHECYVVRDIGCTLDYLCHHAVRPRQIIYKKSGCGHKTFELAAINNSKLPQGLTDTQLVNRWEKEGWDSTSLRLQRTP